MTLSVFSTDSKFRPFCYTKYGRNTVHANPNDYHILSASFHFTFDVLIANPHTVSTQPRQLQIHLKSTITRHTPFLSSFLHPPSKNTQNTQKRPKHSSQLFRHRHGLIRANHCAFRFTIPHQKSLIINLSIMPAEKMSKKHQCVADGVFYAELDEVGAVFPPDSSD